MTQQALSVVLPITLLLKYLEERIMVRINTWHTGFLCLFFFLNFTACKCLLENGDRGEGNTFLLV